MTNSEPPMTADSTDRLTFPMPLCLGGCGRVVGWGHARCYDCGGVAASLNTDREPEPAPARDEGLRAAYVGDVAPTVRAMVLSELPRPEQKATQARASRITGRMVRLLLAEGLLTNDSSAARPVPPGPAATRDGEAGT